MGGKGSKTSAKGIDQDQWQNSGQFLDTQIMRSNKGNGEAQMNNLILDPRFDIDKQMEIYSYRKDQDKALVRCLGAQISKGKKTTMCGNQNGFKVLTERIPKRWNQLPQVSFPESIYALSQSLAGYEDLHSKVGSFDIIPTMMGVNNDGKMKVWLNENFAQNHPSDQKPMLQTTSSTPQEQYGIPSSEASMVQNIVQIIQQKCQSGKFPRDFKNLMDNNSNTFDQAQNAVESYAQQRNLFIPSRLNKNYLFSSSDFNNYSVANNSKMNFTENTNRFTYQTNKNVQQNREPYSTFVSQSGYGRQIGRASGYQQKPAVYQTSSMMPATYAYDTNINSKQYTFNGPKNQQKIAYSPRQSGIIRHEAVNITNNYQSSPKVDSRVYTTYGNVRNQPINNRNISYQSIATSQVTKQY